MKTLIDAFRHAEEVTARGYTFLDDFLEPDCWSFHRTIVEARRRAAMLSIEGLKRGDVIGLVIPDNREFVLTLFGAIMVGIVPVPLFPPVSLGRFPSYLETTTKILSRARARAVVASRLLEAPLSGIRFSLPELEKVIFTETIAERSARPLCEYANATPSDACLLQFTSGSTAEPTGIVVTHGNLISNCHAMMTVGLCADPRRDVGVSWLPLYHDMGLIGFVLAPLLVAGSVILIPPLAFVRRPRVWMETVSKYRGSITFAPNFGLALAAKRGGSQDVLDLSCLRVVGCGAEPIQPATLRRFVEAYSPWGLESAAIMPCYGLAEATLAVTFSDVGRPFEAIRIDGDEYARNRRAVPVTPDPHDTSIEVVACGRALPGHEIAIRHGDEILTDGCVGEIVTRGPSVCVGRADGSHVAHQDGWIGTGDLGFIRSGVLYVSGRTKDIIIINGRNYDPQAIEWQLNEIEGIRAGNVAAFSVPYEGSEALVVVAEATTDRTQTLARDANRVLHAALGIQARQVVFIVPGTLPKTSSGKVQRHKVKELLARGKLEVRS